MNGWPGVCQRNNVHLIVAHHPTPLNPSSHLLHRQVVVSRLPPKSRIHIPTFCPRASSMVGEEWMRTTTTLRKRTMRRTILSTTMKKKSLDYTALPACRGKILSGIQMISGRKALIPVDNISSVLEAFPIIASLLQPHNPAGNWRIVWTLPRNELLPCILQREKAKERSFGPNTRTY